MSKTKHSRLLSLVLTLLCAGQTMAQFTEDFTDGDYLTNPTWIGTYQNFAINPWQQLQTKAATTARSYLSTPCQVNKSAVWRFWCRLAVSPTAYNNLCFYLMSTTEDPSVGDGWLVQVGGSNKNITLRRQKAGKQTVLIEHTDRKKLLLADDNRIEVEVVLSATGEFVLRSKVTGVDADWVEEGRARVGNVGKSNYCSILVKNTKETGTCYYVDNIAVSGEIATEEDWQPAAEQLLLLNELMFAPLADGQEYVEIYNPTGELQYLANIGVTTLNDKGEYMSVNSFPTNATIEPYGYAVLCRYADSLALYHNIPFSSNIFSCSWGKQLPNTGATLCLVSNASGEWKALDSVVYSPDWHHPLLTDTKGVALERIHPDLPGNEAASWHSASKESGYATPGFLNSQYRDIYADEMEKKDHVYLLQKSFSPDGDGYEDVCLIGYDVPANGFVANVRIYTPTGVLVTALPQNELLELSGVIAWDGRNQRGGAVEIGVYVLLCELTNATTGQILRAKLPIVVSAR